MISMVAGIASSSSRWAAYLHRGRLESKRAWSENGLHFAAADGFQGPGNDHAEPALGRRVRTVCAGRARPANGTRQPASAGLACWLLSQILASGISLVGQIGAGLHSRRGGPAPGAGT